MYLQQLKVSHFYIGSFRIIFDGSGIRFRFWWTHILSNISFQAFFSAPPSRHTCSLKNLELESIENLIFYSITWDCHLYAWRHGSVPRQNEVGLNGTHKLMYHDSKTDSDHLGSYIKSHGLTKRCKPGNGAIAFIDREGQQTPMLVVMVRYSKQFYSLIR